MSETTEEDGLREILRQLAVDGSNDTIWTIDGNAQKIVDEAEAAIRRYFAGEIEAAQLRGAYSEVQYIDTKWPPEKWKKRRLSELEEIARKDTNAS